MAPIATTACVEITDNGTMAKWSGGGGEVGCKHLCPEWLVGCLPTIYYNVTL